MSSTVGRAEVAIAGENDQGNGGNHSECDNGRRGGDGISTSRVGQPTCEHRRPVVGDQMA